jgi:hypothetical protein
MILVVNINKYAEDMRFRRAQMYMKFFNHTQTNKNLYLNECQIEELWSFVKKNIGRRGVDKRVRNEEDMDRLSSG